MNLILKKQLTIQIYDSLYVQKMIVNKSKNKINELNTEITTLIQENNQLKEQNKKSK